MRHVVVDDVTHALDIQPARCDIRGDEDIDLAALQSRDRAFALGLDHVAVQSFGGEAARFQSLRQLFRRDLGAREHQHRCRTAPLRECESAHRACACR